MIAGIGAAWIISVLSILEVAGGFAEMRSLLDNFGYAAFVAALRGFVVVLALILVPFTKYGAGFISVLEVILILAYFLSTSKKSVTK